MSLIVQDVKVVVPPLMKTPPPFPDTHSMQRHSVTKRCHNASTPTRRGLEWRLRFDSSKAYACLRKARFDHEHVTMQALQHVGGWSFLIWCVQEGEHAHDQLCCQWSGSSRIELGCSSLECKHHQHSSKTRNVSAGTCHISSTPTRRGLEFPNMGICLRMQALTQSP